MRTIKVGILAEEPLFWGSRKHYHKIVLDGYQWTAKNTTYRFSTSYLFDKDILDGKLNTSNFDVFLIPGGGVGNNEALLKGFNSLRSVRKWKKTISNFVKDGGGIIGICGGAAVITDLTTGPGKTPRTFIERQYNKSSLGISKVVSYFNTLAFPLFYPFQRKHPEKIGASAYVFSFAHGEVADGKHIYTGGASIDFQIEKDNPIFSDFPKNTERIRWWGGQALLVPEDSDREIFVLARFPKEELSDNKSIRIYAWRYIGGFRGIVRALINSYRLIKENNLDLKLIPLFTYYLAGDWEKTDKVIELDFSDKPCITAEIYPNENKGRILLSTAHPEYMIWQDGHIEEVDDKKFNCLATGLHQWKNMPKLSETLEYELTHNWWIHRRFAAWAAKVPDDHFPPICLSKITEKDRQLISNNIFCNGGLINQMKNI